MLAASANPKWSIHTDTPPMYSNIMIVCYTIHGLHGMSLAEPTNLLNVCEAAKSDDNSDAY